MESKGLNPKSLGRKVGRNERLIYDLLGATGDPRIETLTAVATALDMSLTELRDGRAEGVQKIPIVGAVSAGEGWTNYDDQLGELELSLGGGDAIALEIRGDSMLPVYRSGDLIVGVKHDGRSAHNLIGQDCIVQTETGERYLKFLARSEIRGRFNLRSYNPANKDIENVRLLWAAPVVWIRRGGR